MTTTTNSQKQTASQAGCLNLVRHETGALRSVVTKMTLLSVAFAAVATTGCFGVTGGYNLGFLGYPIPVSPYYQHKAVDDFWK